MSARLILDASLCQGHGRCYELAPDVFDADDDGHCVLKMSAIPDELVDKAALGVDNCPELALTLEE
jgi:ferredoxin